MVRKIREVSGLVIYIIDFLMVGGLSHKCLGFGCSLEIKATCVLVHVGKIQQPPIVKHTFRLLGANSVISNINH